MRPTDDLDDVWFLEDSSRRLNLVYDRNYEHALPLEAGLRARVLPDPRLQVFEADAIRCQRGEGDPPWLDGVASEVSYNNVTLPLVVNDTHFHVVEEYNRLAREFTPAICEKPYRYLADASVKDQLWVRPADDLDGA
jgi:hypothetical protein